MAYLGKRKIYNPELHEQHRKECIRTKSGAAFTAFSELEGLINISQLSAQYFGRSQSWLSQKINGCMVFDKKREFKPDEFQQLADAFKDIAIRLNAHAAEIERACLNDVE